MAIDLKEGLSIGLRSDKYQGRNALGMVQYLNMRPTSGGARPYEPMTSAISSAELAAESITVGHPFPQIFRGKGVTLLADETALYTVNETTWLLTKVPTYDIHDQASEEPIVAGGPWHFVDFHTSYMLFNGNTTLIGMPGYSAKVFSNTAAATSHVSIQTGCAFKGQLVLGGFNAASYWSSAWQAIWTAMLDKGIGEWGYSIAAPSTNWVWWSSIGGGDILDIYLPEYASGENMGSGGHTAARPLYLETAKRLESGAMPMPWQGYVRAVLPMRDVVMVYGDSGVSALIPSTGPVPTFGLEEQILKVGIMNRGAVGGDYQRQLFIDNTGVLWSIAQNMQLVRLGYKEFFSAMSTNDITITHEPNRGEFYISDDTKCYMLNEKGLSEGPQLITSGFQAEGGFAGIYEAASEVSDGILKTEIFSGPGSFPTTVSLIEIMFRAPYGVAVGSVELPTVTLYSRFHPSESFSGSANVVDVSGRFHTLRTGQDFYVTVAVSDYTKIAIDNIRVHFKEGGKLDLSTRIL